MPVLASMPVIEPVAVADVEALLAAIPPDRELDEPGEDRRETTIELPSVDLAGDQPDNVGAAAWPVTAGPVGWAALNRARIPVRCRKLWTRVSTAINCTPTSSHLGRTSAAPIRMPDIAIARTCRQRRRRCASARSGQRALATTGLERRTRSPGRGGDRSSRPGRHRQRRE
jgi:hypothetical protein